MDKRKEEFKKHYENYDIEETAIKRKYYHSLRVMDLSILIAKYLGLNNKDITLASFIGLLHDYARFEQWTKYKTYSDKDSIDHGDLAVKRLFEDNEIINYDLDVNDYEIVYNAIKYHNKIAIPYSLDNRIKLFCKIIRDADKLDIFYLRTNKSFVKEGGDISLKIENDFFNEQSINKMDVMSYNDEIISVLAMIYDLNFDYSYEYLDKSQLIWKMYSVLEDKKRFEKYFDYIDKYIKRRMG